MKRSATTLARLDYAALAQGFGVQYSEILQPGELPDGIAAAMSSLDPLLIRVAIDYGKRPIR